jgi:phospholipid transport system substrate-binding protein
MLFATAGTPVRAPCPRAVARRAAVPAALALVLALSASGWAGSPTDQLRELFAAAARILADPATEGRPEVRMSAIHTLVRGAFDFREAARLSLGPDWDERTPAEQARFERLFADLLERSFIRAVTSRVDVGDGIKVSFLGESMDGATAIVRTTIVARSGLELPFDYRMIERDGGWAVCDVAIDGVSIAANYRAQFARVIQASSYPELVRQIQAKVSDAGGQALVGESPALMARTAGAHLPSGLGGEEAGARAGEPPRPAPAALARTHIGLTPVRLTGDEADGAARSRLEPVSASRERRLAIAPLALTAGARSPSAPAPSAHAYWVQIGAFKSAAAAGRLAAAIRRQEGPMSSPRVSVEALPSPVALTRVRIGPFADRAAAAVKLRELQGRGYQPFIADARN